MSLEPQSEFVPKFLFVNVNEPQETRIYPWLPLVATFLPSANEVVER